VREGAGPQENKLLGVVPKKKFAYIGVRTSRLIGVAATHLVGCKTRKRGIEDIEKNKKKRGTRGKITFMVLNKRRVRSADKQKATCDKRSAKT